MDITEKNLKEWKDKGYSYEKIAEITGLSQKTVGYYMKKYKLTKKRSITDQDIKQFCEMRQDGYSTERIVELTGHSYSTVYKVLKESGMIPDRLFNRKQTVNEESTMFTPRILHYAEKKKPKILRIVAAGKRYLDITDLWI